ncbi:cell division protein ZapA [Arsenicibacter rosenii]|uniref:Cell division protein ZapA n=1 Tax=Arsenicibacter rosenii TaxID=1750698 RepID=A0A1S2VCV8_9BACT|nr:cell division protein ZapA [Arsenicibacter rosenii]OIN56544.1 cell division protein ZapA [Arsenicibacter rosenii]
MEDQLSIRIKIADRDYRLKSQPGEEAYVRKAEKILEERIEHYRKLGARDTQDILAMIAVDCLVARQKGEEQMQRLQRLVVDRITQLDQIITPALVP